MSQPTQPSVNETDRLATLVTEITRGHDRCLKAMRTALNQARAVGMSLIEAKDLVKGMAKDWLPWLNENCGVSHSQAQRYMRIAEHYPLLLKTCSDPDNLTMAEALRLLSPKGKRAQSGDSNRIKVASQPELTDQCDAAELVVFPADSAAAKLVVSQSLVVARTILKAAGRKGGHKDNCGEGVSAVVTALALLQQIKAALKIELIVAVDERPTINGVESKVHQRSSSDGQVQLVAA